MLLSHAVGPEGKHFSSTSELSFQTQLSSQVSEQSHSEAFVTSGTRIVRRFPFLGMNFSSSYTKTPRVPSDVLSQEDESHDQPCEQATPGTPRSFPILLIA